MTGETAAGGDARDGRPKASQSLYRKYRPASFDETELVGQEHVSRTLRNAVRHGRVAHAYLFCGPRGCGKTTSARLLAKAVNCEAADPDARPCNACPSCRAINEGRAVDIIEIDAASNRGIDDIRDLREKVKFAPAQLRTKFYIIDEVHQLTKEASNALLKTLEEPPPHAAFILATTDPEQVLETISSRCQTFLFHRIPLDRMIERLRHVCAAEGLRADDAALAAIARAATGSLRDALGLLDQLSAYGDEGITAETVRQVLGAGGREQVVALVDALAARDVAAGLRAINAVVDGGADARQFAGQVVEYLRDLLLILARPQPQRGQRAGGPEPAVEPAHRDAFALGEVATLVKRFSQVDYGLKHSAYGHLPLELCLVESVLALQGETGPGRPAEAPRPVAAREAPARPRPVASQPPTATAQPALAAPDAAPRPEGDLPPPLPPPTPLRPEVAARPPEADAPPRPVAARPAETRPVAVPRDAEEGVDAGPMAARPEATGTAPATPPDPAPDDPAQEPRRASAVTLAQVQDRWLELRQRVKAVNRSVEALLSSVDPRALDDGVLTIVARHEFHRKKLNEDGARGVVEDVLLHLFGERYRVACVSPEEAAASAAPPAARPAAAPEPAVRASSPPAPQATPAPVRPATPPPPEDDEIGWFAGDAAEPAPAVVPAGAEPPARAFPTRPEGSARPVQPPVSGNGATGPTPPISPNGGEQDGYAERYINAARNIFNAVEIKR